MKLSTRMALAMVALVLLSSAVFAVLTYNNVMALIVPRALDRLQTNARLSAMVMEATLRSLRADAQSTQASPSVHALIDALAADPPNLLEAAHWREVVEKWFAAELAGKPEYSLIRIIGVANDGRELVRVDRLGPDGGIRIAPESGLLRRGDRSYFQEGLALPPHVVHISKVELNKTGADFDDPAMPTIRSSAPVFDKNDKAAATVVINVDLRPALARLRAGFGPLSEGYVVNETGDYLVHPDRTKEFGFERGKRHQIQHDFPEFAEAIRNLRSDARMMRRTDGEEIGLGWEWVQLAGGPRIAVIEARPSGALLNIRGAVSVSTLLGGGGAILCAVLMAFVVSRSLTKPLVKITKAVESFGKGEIVAVTPSGSSEVVVLAEAFLRMTAEARRKANALSEEVTARSRIADMLNNTLHNMVDPVMITDADGRIVLSNAAATKLFGHPMDIGNPGAFRAFERYCADGVTPLPFERSPLLRAFRGEVVENFEFVARPCGSEQQAYLIANGRPLLDQDGAVQGAVMVYHDVSRTKAAERELRESERMARAILDTALDAFIQISPPGLISEWSPHAETMFGWSRDEAIGRNIVDLIFTSEQLPDLTARYRNFIAAIDQGGTGSRIEVEALRRDGTTIHVEVSMTALLRDNGYTLNTFFRDLTDKTIAEQQLRQAQKMESIGQLTGGIAHDFNNMLTVITGTIDILAASVADRPECAAITKLISESADRGAELTRHLLAFARKQPLQPCETDPNIVLSELQILLRPTLGEHIEIKETLQDGVWPIFVDRGQLEAALVNLAVNARDAMLEGGTLMLETSNVVIDQDFIRRYGEGEPGPYVMITVTDSGYGIPEAIRSRVFDPFFTTKEVGKGTGLGLSMVYGFIKQSGGHVTVYSEVGHGSSFRIYLPRAKSEGKPATPEEPTTETEVGGTETILIVEDDAMVRNYVIAQLRGLGYQTLAAGNAAAALELTDKGAAFDLLFTDIVMPGRMNGAQLAVEMAKRRPGLKVLYTSGYSENAVIHNNRLDPDILLLTKPYRRTELARMVRLALATAAAPQPERRAAELSAS